MTNESHPRIAQECVCCGGRKLSGRPAILMPFVANRVFGWEPVEIDESWGLRDVRCGMAYPLCRTLKCDSCGLIFLDIRFDEAEIAKLYDGYRDDGYVAQRVKYEPNYRQTNDTLVGGSAWIPQVERIIRKHVPRVDSVLDWGGDTGLNTPFRREASVHHVYDISQAAVVPGAARVDLEVAKSGDYDLIVSSHVLEHVPFPLEMLEELTDAMGERTRAWVEVPFEEVVRTATDPDRAYMQKRYWHEHVNFFTQDALRRVLERAGLAVLEIAALDVAFGEETHHILGAVCRRAG